MKKAGALLLAVAAGGMLVAGCDIPTALPILEQRWALVAAETRLGVEDLLPDGAIALTVADGMQGDGARLTTPGRASQQLQQSQEVACEAAPPSGEVVSGEGSITVSAEPICVAWTLADLCPACSVGRPLTLDTTRERSWTLPEEVVSVRISGGTVQLTLDHDLDFTPLRANELQIVAVSTGTGAGEERELLRWVLEEDLAPGTAVTFSHDFGGTPVTVRGGLRLQFFIATATDESRPAVSDLQRVIRARAEVRSVTIDSAVVRVDDLDLGGEPREFDLGEQGDVEELVERIQGGSATAIIDNDFPAGISGTITIGDRTRAVVIAPEATSEVTISYTRAELQELLRGPITYSWTGAVTSAGERRFDADMRLTIKVRIDITVRTEQEQEQEA